VSQRPTGLEHQYAAAPDRRRRRVLYLAVRSKEGAVTDLWEAQREALGAFIRDQRKRANLSLRQLAEMTSLSNPYLSQVERGLHQPSVRVLKAISDALNLSAETLMAQAGLIDAIATTSVDGTSEASAEARGIPDTEDAIRADQRLSDEQKAALIAVYRSMLGSAASLGGTALNES
jgi:transcriptional regulator with XRE-family HTH domain